MKDDATIRALFFFDGTGDNKTNSKANPAKFGNLTNVAKLYEATNETKKFYIEGVGTMDNKEDSDFAKATGNNVIGKPGYSYKDKLNLGLNQLNTLVSANSNRQIELFVYGFSRGATLARDFTKRALLNSNVKIRFLGIYDTVVTLLTERPEIFFSDQELMRIDQILHLTAINECRKFFPLTSLKNKNGARELVEIKQYHTDKVKEIFVPGAHADVGGGYFEQGEKAYLNQVRSSQDALRQLLDKIRTSVKDDFSCDPQLIWPALLGNNVQYESLTIGTNLYSERQNVPVAMSEVYFEVMADFTNSFSNERIFSYASSIVITELKSLKKEVSDYVTQGAGQKGPCYTYNNYAQFTHISSNYGLSAENDTNVFLNTFHPTKLNLEIEQAKEQYPDASADIIEHPSIYNAFGLVDLGENAPNNDQWRRDEIYGS
ncbi:DUF2235 domain-containing protein [Myroides odoratus]|uniref:T6SS phospholipase effector Tle1-like catalytic domain-containing protein n=1 Tax=Myroides odoratus TaxID=256 RepID=UPI003341FCD9